MRREIDAHGEPVRGGRDIEPGEAEVVRRIFAMFSAGASPNAIAKKLNEESIPGPGKRPWGDSTIRGHAGRKTGVLRNELYVGCLVWNRQRYVKDPQSGNRISRPNPPDQWITEDVPELRIVEPGLWNTVQQKLEEVAASPRSVASRVGQFWEQRRAQHLLSGVVRCGCCGSRFQPMGRDYIRCSSAHRNSACTSRLSIRRGVLESYVLDALQQQLMAPEIVEEFVREFHTELNRARSERGAQQAVAARKLEQTERQIDALVSALAEGMKSTSIAARLSLLEAEREVLAGQARLEPERPVRMHPNLAGLYRKKVEARAKLWRMRKRARKR